MRRLVVRRSSSAWGFTVVSKLEDENGEVTLPDVSRPEGMTHLINRPAFYDEQQHINARAAKWLKQRMEKDITQQEINALESKKLNDLAGRVSYIDTYFHPDELEKWDSISILYSYYHQAFYAELPSPPDDIGKYQLSLSSKKASALVRSIINIDISDANANFGDEEDERIICKDGTYYIWAGDPEYPEYYLSAYQYVGNDTFYLSFDVDDRWMSGAEISKKGIIADDYRLIVKRSDSEWGFTVLSKLKDGNETILPDDFPPPKHPIAYEPKKLA